MATQAQKLADFREASRMFKEAQRLLRATGEAAGMLPSKRTGAPETQTDPVAKARGDHPLVAIAKARAGAAKSRLRLMRIDEVSLVDAPSCPGAVVVMQKSGGSRLVEMARAKREAAR